MGARFIGLARGFVCGPYRFGEAGETRGVREFARQRAPQRQVVHESPGETPSFCQQGHAFARSGEGVVEIPAFGEHAREVGESVSE